MEKPYNNAHGFGLAVDEVEEPENDDVMLHVRVGLFDNIRRKGKPAGLKRRFTAM